MLWIQRLGILLKVGGNVREGRAGEVLLTVTVEVLTNRDFCPFLLLFFFFFFFEIRSHSIALAGLEIMQTRLALNSENKPVSQVARLKVRATTPSLVNRYLVLFRAPAGQCRAELCHWWVHDDTIRVKKEIVALNF